MDSMDGLVVKSHSALRPLMVQNLDERRLFSFCIQHYDSRPDARNPLYFEISIDEFKKTFPEYAKFKPTRLFLHIEAIMNSINSKGYRPDPGKRRTVWWFQEFEITDEGMIVFGLTQAAQPFFLDLQDHYISYHMSDIQFLQKPNTWNLYEYIKERFQNGQRLDWKVTVSELRERLNMLEKYKKRFNAFREYCIERPVQEINKETDLTVKYTVFKKGRTPFRIKFNVFKKHSDPSVVDIEDQIKVFREELDRAGINKKVAEKYVQLATKQTKISAMLEMIPKAKKSWGKNGKGPWPAYLSGILQKKLMEPDMFEDFEKKEKEKAYKKETEEFEKMTDGDLRTLSETGNIYAKKVLAERKAKK